MTSVFRSGGHKKFESLRINLSDLNSQQDCDRDPGHFQPWNTVTRSGTTPGIPSKIKGDLKIKPISECRSDERLKTKSEESTRLSVTTWIGETGTPKDKDEVNRLQVSE